MIFGASPWDELKRLTFSGPVKAWAYGEPWARADSISACRDVCTGLGECTHFGFTSAAGGICFMSIGEFRAMDGKVIEYGEL